MKNLPRILITPGEPAGIGPDITLQAASQRWPCEVIAIADPQMLSDRAKALGLDINIIEITENSQSNKKSVPGTLQVFPIQTASPVIPGQLDVLNAAYVLRTLEIATKFCLEGKAQALVTGPVQKSLLQDAGIAFSGHTEFLAEQSGVSLTVMLFVLKEFKVALATTHLPLHKVPTALSKDHLLKVIGIIEDEFKNKFHITQPRIAVCGVNPHAGESGYLGREEIDVIQPAIDELRNEGKAVSGPYPADTIFLPHQLPQFDVVLSMYHDQALPLVKYLGFDTAVNMTLGLPFIRTSVDHGTALELAGTGKANAGSLKAALKLAANLSR